MSTIRFEQDGNLGIITLNDPPLNLVSPSMVDGLEAAVAETRSSGVRALLMRAEGDNFSAGANVAEMFQGEDASGAFKLLSRVAENLADAEALPIPTVAAVKGFCLTGGLELALACDVIWAADNTTFGQSEAVIGAIPFGGGAQRIASCVGPYKAREIVYGARMYTAADFERFNIANRVLPLAELDEKVLKYAHTLANGPTLAHGITKKLVRTVVDEGIRAADKRIPELAPPLFESEDMRHGIESLLANGPGKAQFSGK